MDIIVCTCAHGIPGVVELPSHYHVWSQGDRYETHTYTDEEIAQRERIGLHGPSKVQRLVRDPDAEVRFLVDWKMVAKELVREFEAEIHTLSHNFLTATERATTLEREAVEHGWLVR